MKDTEAIIKIFRLQNSLLLKVLYGTAKPQSVIDLLTKVHSIIDRDATTRLPAVDNNIELIPLTDAEKFWMKLEDGGFPSTEIWSRFCLGQEKLALACIMRCVRDKRVNLRYIGKMWGIPEEQRENFRRWCYRTCKLLVGKTSGWRYQILGGKYDDFIKSFFPAWEPVP